MSFTGHHSIEKTNLILDLISKKQKAHAANITNMNTPHYKKQEVDFAKYIGIADSPLETQLSKLLGASPHMQKSGGDVNISQELFAMQKNSLLYSMATRRMSAIIKEMKQIVQVGR